MVGMEGIFGALCVCFWVGCDTGVSVVKFGDRVKLAYGALCALSSCGWV